MREGRSNHRRGEKWWAIIFSVICPESWIASRKWMTITSKIFSNTICHKMCTWRYDLLRYMYIVTMLIDQHTIHNHCTLNTFSFVELFQDIWYHFGNLIWVGFNDYLLLHHHHWFLIIIKQKSINFLSLIMLVYDKFYYLK